MLTTSIKACILCQVMVKERMPFLKRSVFRPSLFIILGITCLSASTPSFGKEEEWDLSSNQDGITIFQRQLPGSRLQEVKGQIKINAPLATVLTVIGGSEHWTDWMPRTLEARVVQKTNQGFLFYTVFKGFGPVWDRDVYLLMTPHCTQVAPALFPLKRVEIRFTTEFAKLQGQMPPTKASTIRIPKMVGHWYIWPAELPTKTYVEYQAYVDAGGQLTNFLKNVAARTLVKRALRNLQKQTQKFPEPDYKRIKQDAPGLFPDCVAMPTLSF